MLQIREKPGWTRNVGLRAMRALSETKLACGVAKWRKMISQAGRLERSGGSLRD